MSRTRKLKDLGLEEEDRRYFNKMATGFSSLVLGNKKSIDSTINFLYERKDMFYVDQETAKIVLNDNIRTWGDTIEDLLIYGIFGEASYSYIKANYRDKDW